MVRVAALDPACYTRHRLHQGDRIWAETNCYTDVVIELLHGLGHEPMALLPFTLTIDFDLDQWTFFKPPTADLEQLYGLTLCEMVPWRSLAGHCEEHVAAGRPVLVELDSFFLPDTQGTAYKLAHTKSTVAINTIDVAARRMEYFHNQGYFLVEGQDFADVFQLDGLVHPRMLPPYIEFLKPLPRQGPAPDPVGVSLGLLRAHLTRRPVDNPFPRFRARFARDLEWLATEPIDSFHAYSFVTLRQYGACFELAASYLGWLDEQGVDGVTAARDELLALTTGTKTYQFQLARAMARRRPLDLAPLDEMARRWDAALGSLVGRFG